MILIGRQGCGKTTLARALGGLACENLKTQAVEYVGQTIDTPGEYLENRFYYKALIVSSYDSDVVFFLQSATDPDTSFPPGFGGLFAKEVCGVVTKIDCEDADVSRASEFLELAGVNCVFPISVVENIGLSAVLDFLN